jgi:hypothetical protein
MKKQYLIEAGSGHAIWCGDEVPVLTETSAMCGDETFLCYSVENAFVLEADAVQDFQQRKYLAIGKNLVVDPSWVEPVIDPMILASLKKSLADSIDDRVAEVTVRWTRFKEGYAKREAAAREYKLAGYTGDPTRWITSFATNANKTTQQATDIIIAQADGLNLALEDLEDLRMQKYKILLANDETVIRSEHQRIMSEIDVIVGGLT